MAQNGHFPSFDKVPFVGTLKFCQKIPDIMKSESINLITKLQPKWPINGLKWPKIALKLNLISNARGPKSTLSCLNHTVDFIIGLKF